ncbi:hypothetical protein [Aquirufa nivalisilvae]|uniref:hypothetical protein n=1 Tax=Aquirufa nivalisilvae TaxID=2516557 RepID=UPI0022A99EE8|nr:hypothetical protein [Aquirufa nivalisilvae]
MFDYNLETLREIALFGVWLAFKSVDLIKLSPTYVGSQVNKINRYFFLAIFSSVQI